MFREDARGPEGAGLYRGGKATLPQILAPSGLWVPHLQKTQHMALSLSSQWLTPCSESPCVNTKSCTKKASNIAIVPMKFHIKKKNYNKNIYVIHISIFALETLIPKWLEHE